MNKPLYSLLLILWILAANLAFSQNTEDALKFRLSLKDGKTVCRIGEPVELILSYTSTKPDYVVESVYSPRFDDVIISPTDGIYDWLYRVNRLYSYDDVIASQKLSQIPVNVEITVNNLVRFDKPGKYKVKVISRRVRKSTKEFPYGFHPIPVLSNEIEFEMKDMSEGEEQAEVKRISALMDSAKTLPQYQTFQRELNYLTGDASTIEKVNRFLHPPVYGGVSWLDSGTGLNIARNKKLAIKLLEDVFHDPNQEVSRYLIGEIIGLRVLMEDEAQPSQAEEPQELWKERDPRFSELNKFYYAELFDSLPKRTGRSQLMAAYTIVSSMPKDAISDTNYNTAKALLLEKFDDLKYYEQSDLLNYHWDKIKSSLLIPYLDKILSSKEPLPNWSNRENALKRLIELDEKRARPFVMNEIRESNSSIRPDILVMLSDEYLPDVDDALLEQIQKMAATKDYRIQQKAMLVSRYATKKIYQPLLDIYKKYESTWSDETCGRLLRYFARINDKETIPLIEERIAKSKFDKSGSYLFYNMTRFEAGGKLIPITKGMQQLLQKRLESDDFSLAEMASAYLSEFPNQKNRKLIQKRYDRWLKEWGGRGTELDNPKADNTIKNQAQLQIALLRALIWTKSWKLSDNEIYNLKISCLTQACRQTFSRYVPPKN